MNHLLTSALFHSRYHPVIEKTVAFKSWHQLMSIYPLMVLSRRNRLCFWHRWFNLHRVHHESGMNPSRPVVALKYYRNEFYDLERCFTFLWTNSFLFAPYLGNLCVDQFQQRIQQPSRLSPVRLLSPVYPKVTKSRWIQRRYLLNVRFFVSLGIGLRIDQHQMGSIHQRSARETDAARRIQGPTQLLPGLRTCKAQTPYSMINNWLNHN